jgi:hypothetical protein
MAMVPAVLTADVLAVFKAMWAAALAGDFSKDDRYMADEIAAAVKRFILTGQTATSDSGTVPINNYPYTGAGVGIMTIDDGPLADDLYDTFRYSEDDIEIANGIAADIDKACSVEDTVEETSTGTYTDEDGYTHPYSGPAIGRFTGSPALISAPLIACFQRMYVTLAPDAGDLDFATTFGTCVNAYMLAGTINVKLAAPFTGGSGSGKIA